MSSLIYKRSFWNVALVVGVLVTPSFVFAEIAPNSVKDESSSKAAAVVIETLIQNLGHRSYKTRIDATRKLMELGQAAITPLTAAAETDNQELATRCVSILRALYEGNDSKTKNEAEAALKKLEQSKYPAVAKQAGDAIRKPPKNTFANRTRFGRGIIIRNVAPANIARGRLARQIVREFTVKQKEKTYQFRQLLAPKRELNVKVTETVNGKKKTTEIKTTSPTDLRKKHPKIYELYRRNLRQGKITVEAVKNAGNVKGAQPQPAAGAIAVRGANISISTRTVNGKREMNITENGRKIQIQDENQKNIVIRVTDTVNGKQKTTEYKAKDLAELKKKHPEAAKLFEKYTKNANFGIRFPAVRFRGRAGALPNIAPPAIPRNIFGRAQNTKKVKAEIEKANKKLAAAIEKLNKLAASKNAKPEDLKNVAKEIQVAREDLEQAYNALK